MLQRGSRKNADCHAQFQRHDAGVDHAIALDGAFVVDKLPYDRAAYRSDPRRRAMGLTLPVANLRGARRDQRRRNGGQRHRRRAQEDKDPEEAVRKACLPYFRPILMKMKAPALGRFANGHLEKFASTTRPQ
jgi:hypothetical protein